MTKKLFYYGQKLKNFDIIEVSSPNLNSSTKPEEKESTTFFDSMF